jgi:hypothetical protein
MSFPEQRGRRSGEIYQVHEYNLYELGNGSCNRSQRGGSMNILQEAELLRKKIIDLQKESEQAKDKLRSLENNCRHDFGKTVYVPEYYPGYMSPGDPPGTMGVDRQLPMYISAKTIKKWERKCKICGKTETTKRIKEISIEEPEF